MKWAVDPGLDGDAYAEKPYLYGNALSSVNVLRVGGKEGEVMVDGVIGIEEGGEGGGEEVRKELGVPATAGERKKWFLKGEEKERWVWEGGRVYWGDFFNGFLDFNGEVFFFFTFRSDNFCCECEPGCAGLMCFHLRNRFLTKTTGVFAVRATVSRRGGLAEICAEE